MKIVFVYWAFVDQGSGLIIKGYEQAARALGHEVTVYGRTDTQIALSYSLELAQADAVLFIFEWTTDLLTGDQLDLLRLTSRVPRQRRVVLDGDGKYNDWLTVAGDYNHDSAQSAAAWREICDSLTDKIYQPTRHPLRANVGSFLFYAYNPAWERPLQPNAKPVSVSYVGHSKFRWPVMLALLQQIAPIREQLQRVRLVGHGWDAPPHWADSFNLRDAYYSDPAFLEELAVETAPAVPFEAVIDTMGQATVNPVLTRPLFSKLHIVTPRMFETVASGTIPLFMLPADFVCELYGPAGLELAIGDGNAGDKLLDVQERLPYYLEVVGEVRGHLAQQHAHAVRMRRLLEIIEA